MNDSNHQPQPLAGTPFYVMPDGALGHATEDGISPLPTVSYGGITYTQIPDPDTPGNFGLATFGSEEGLTEVPVEQGIVKLSESSFAKIDTNMGNDNNETWMYELSYDTETGVMKLMDGKSFATWEEGEEFTELTDVSWSQELDQWVIKLPDDGGIAACQDSQDDFGAKPALISTGVDSATGIYQLEVPDPLSSSKLSENAYATWEEGAGFTSLELVGESSGIDGGLIMSPSTDGDLFDLYDPATFGSEEGLTEVPVEQGIAKLSESSFSAMHVDGDETFFNPLNYDSATGVITMPDGKSFATWEDSGLEYVDEAVEKQATDEAQVTKDVDFLDGDEDDKTLSGGAGTDTDGQPEIFEYTHEDGSVETITYVDGQPQSSETTYSDGSVKTTAYADGQPQSSEIVYSDGSVMKSDDLDADGEGEFQGEMTSAGTLTLKEDGSGPLSWESADQSQSASWEADGSGTYQSPQGEGAISNTSYDAETGTVTFTDDMNSTGTITSDGTLNLQFSDDDGSDGEGSELDDIFSSAGLGDSDGDSGEESTATDAAGEILNELETEIDAEKAGADGGTDTTDSEPSTDQEPVDEGESDEEWKPPPEDS